MNEEQKAKFIQGRKTRCNADIAKILHREGLQLGVSIYVDIDGNIKGAEAALKTFQEPRVYVIQEAAEPEGDSEVTVIADPEGTDEPTIAGASVEASTLEAATE